jgi:hypothetical protein
MKIKYDYMLLYEGFHDWLETHKIPILSKFLFLELLHLFNLSGWSEWIQVGHGQIMKSIQAKRENNARYFRDVLLEEELLIYVKGKKGTPSKYKLNDKISFIERAKKR